MGLGNKTRFLGGGREPISVKADRKSIFGLIGLGRFQFTFRDSRIFASFALLGAVLAGAFLSSVDLPHADVRAYGALVGILAAVFAKGMRVI